MFCTLLSLLRLVIVSLSLLLVVVVDVVVVSAFLFDLSTVDPRWRMSGGGVGEKGDAID